VKEMQRKTMWLREGKEVYIYANRLRKERGFRKQTLLMGQSLSG